MGDSMGSGEVIKGLQWGHGDITESQKNAKEIMEPIKGQKEDEKGSFYGKRVRA